MDARSRRRRAAGLTGAGLRRRGLRTSRGPGRGHADHGLPGQHERRLAAPRGRVRLRGAQPVAGLELDDLALRAQPVLLRPAAAGEQRLRRRRSVWTWAAWCGSAQPATACCTVWITTRWPTWRGSPRSRSCATPTWSPARSTRSSTGSTTCAPSSTRPSRAGCPTGSVSAKSSVRARGRCSARATARAATSSARAASIDNATTDFTFGVHGQAGGLDLDYEILTRNFRENGPTPTGPYEQALPPGHDGGATRPDAGDAVQRPALVPERGVPGQPGARVAAHRAQAQGPGGDQQRATS